MGACRLVFMFASRKIPSVEHQTGALRGKIPATKWGTQSGKNLTAEGFSSCRLIKKGHVVESALPSPSGKNPISRAYKHSLLSERNPNSERTDSELGKFQQRSSFEW